MTGATPTADAPYVLVVSLAKRDPMCTLFFTHLAGRVPMRIVQYPADDTVGPLSGASAVVIIRGLFEFGPLIACAEWLKVPLYYFQDDNFMLIREEEQTYGSIYERYTNDAVRSTLTRFDGVLLATPSLVDYFREQRLHNRLWLYPPVAGPSLNATSETADRPLTIAFFGGQHRREPFVRHVYPAIVDLARGRPIRIIAAGIDPEALPPAEGVEVVFPKYDASYTAALQLVAQYGVDILVHPSAITANNIFKNPHVLINAGVIGAAPIFTNEPPYEVVADAGVALLCENTRDSWYAALSRLAADPTLRASIRERLSAYCATHFSGAVNVQILSEMLRMHPAPSPSARAWRFALATARFSAARVTGRISRLIAR